MALPRPEPKILGYRWYRSGTPTLAEWARISNNTAGLVAEELMKVNEILNDLKWEEIPEPPFTLDLDLPRHPFTKITFRTSLPDFSHTFRTSP